MVSWGDGEESSDCWSSDGTDSINTVYDSDFCGLADDGEETVHCHCRSAAGRFVAFEGCNTGRRFLACAGQEGIKCEFVRWIDVAWPEALQKSLIKLWDMYAEVKQGRVGDALDRMEDKLKLQDEISKLHVDLRMAQDELKKVVDEKQMTLALKAKAEQGLIDARAELEQKKILDANTCNMHKCLMIKAEKDRDKNKEEKRKLEYMIADLLAQKEGSKAKFKKIRELCDF